MPSRQRQPGSSTASFYSQWRDACQSGAFRDAPNRPPTEQLLQAIWQHQRLHRDALRDTNGRPLSILHPGFCNHEPGPDFRAAVIQFGDDLPLTGDVEVDPLAADWHAHGHDANPSFTTVILHVIWNGPAKTALPTLRLQPHLDAPIKDLADWHATQPPFPLEFTGQCRAPLAAISAVTQNDLFLQAALIRLQAKADTITHLARRHGWEAALWHGLFRALGYKHNTWPLQNLAERLPVLRALGPVDALGCAGLLTNDLPTQPPAARRHLRQLWDCWWRERDALGKHQLPSSLWRFAGLRPANHPLRRLTLLAHWLAWGDLPARLQHWLQTDHSKSRLAPSLTQTLHVQPDAFWRHHWTFKSPRQPRPCPLLGTTRATDLAINVLLPWFHARARAGRNPTLLARIKARYTTWPTAQDNALLKLARQRLSVTPRCLPTAAHQQGLLQIIRDFCDYAPATCKDCRFPDLVRSFPS